KSAGTTSPLADETRAEHDIRNRTREAEAPARRARLRRDARRSEGRHPRRGVLPRDVSENAVDLATPERRAALPQIREGDGPRRPDTRRRRARAAPERCALPRLAPARHRKRPRRYRLPTEPRDRPMNRTATATRSEAFALARTRRERGIVSSILHADDDAPGW